MAGDVACWHHCWTSGRSGNGLGGRTGPRECDDQTLAVPSAGGEAVYGDVRTEHCGLLGYKYIRYVRQASSSFLTMIWPSPVGNPWLSSYTTAWRICSAVWRTRSLSSCQRQ